MHSTLINMLHVDDFFDVGKFTKEDVKLMTTDISVFLHFKFSENVPCLKNGEIINEEAERTLSITEIKEKLKGFGFNSWFNTCI